MEVTLKEEKESINEVQDPILLSLIWTVCWGYGLASVSESRLAVLKMFSLKHGLIHFLNNQFIEQLSCVQLHCINHSIIWITEGGRHKMIPQQFRIMNNTGLFI